MTRLLSGLSLALLFLAIIWFSSTLVLLGVAAGVAGLAFHEYLRIAGRVGAHVPWMPALAGTLAAVVMIPFPVVAIEVVLSAALIASAISVMLSSRTGPAGLHDTAAAVLAPLYIGLPFGALVALHQIAGRNAVLLLLATVIVSDSGQYYAGRAFGRTPLAPRLSPKKTREGAVGGFVLAPVLLVVAGPYALPAAGPAWLVALGLLVVAAGIAGDLFESMLKRAAGMKDSSTLIPGHGGVLDRIDALLFATPVFYYFVRAL